MGLADIFGKDDRIEIKMIELYEILRTGAKVELLMNAVNCDVPHRYIREMATGGKEDQLNETGSQGGTGSGESGLASEN